MVRPERIQPLTAPDTGRGGRTREKLLIAALSAVSLYAGGTAAVNAFNGYVAEKVRAATEAAQYEAAENGKREGFLRAVCAADATGRLNTVATRHADLETTGAFSSDAETATHEIDAALAECPRSN